MSVPVIRYHASDDELEELYPSTDDEKGLTPESEKTSPRSSPRRCRISISDSGDGCEGTFEKRSTSMDENLSEGTPPSDPWKVLTSFKGKVTKAFEETISEIKSERKKSKHNRSRDTSSVSDYEDLGDATPTDDTNSEKQEKESYSPVLRQRSHSSKFVGFSSIKTGLKTNNSEEDSVENGIEAAELSFEYQSEEIDLCFVEENNQNNKFREGIRYFLPEIFIPTNLVLSESDRVFIQLKNKIYYELFTILTVLCCCYFVPLPKYLMGIWAGIFVSYMVQKICRSVNKLLTMPIKSIVPVLEIPAVEEHAILDKFEGWLNELPYRYDPDNYHLARTKPVFFKLEGEVLQVMETRSRIPKRAVSDEPKLKPKFIKKRAYCLAGAKVELLPSGLIRRRYEYH